MMIVRVSLPSPKRVAMIDPYRTRHDLAATIASLCIAARSPVLDARAVAAAFGVPWRMVVGMVREQVGEREVERG